MIMETLQLKEIAGYITHGLKVVWNNTYIGKAISMYAGYDLIDIEFDYGVQRHSIKDVKLYLRPMSSLTKTLPDGKIPICELAKICYKKPGYNARLINGECHVVNAKDAPIIRFSWDNSHKSFYADYTMYDGRIYINDRSTGIHNSVELFDYLHEHMLDYRGLIQRGLAIDLNSVKEK